MYRWTNPLPGKALTVPVERYTSREFHDLEVERVWKKVWQVACRVEDILDAGQYVKYDIADVSVLVVRQRDGSIRAHRNICLHRGRTLKEQDGIADSFSARSTASPGTSTARSSTCPASGTSRRSTANGRSSRCRSTPGADSSSSTSTPRPVRSRTSSATLPEHFTAWPLEKRYKQVHVGKVLRCNWKLAQEAFMESWHVVATHAQLLPGLGDTISKYDAVGQLLPDADPQRGAQPAPQLAAHGAGDDGRPDRSSARRADPRGRAGGPDRRGSRWRTTAAAHLEHEIGAEEAQALSDAEMCDSMPYTLFPNIHPWGSYNRTCYRFRPYGNDPGLSIMECMILSPYEGDTPPKGAELKMVEMDTSWTTVPELGLLARVFDQDDANLPFVQKGLESGSLDEVTFAEYQETKIRHFHIVLEEWFG